MRAHRNSKGFTIFELLAVFAIIAILSAIVAPKIFATIKTAKLKADLVTISSIERVEKEYFFFNREHSFDVDKEQTADNFHGSLDKLSSFINNVQFQIVTDVKWVLEDDKWHIAYEYEGSQGDDPVEPEPDDWDSSKNYTGNSEVKYNGAVYIARNWVGAGVVPGTVGAPWQELTTEWRNFNRYIGGDTVTYDGAEFEAWHNMSPGYGNPIPTPGTVGAPWQELTTEWRNFNKYSEGATVTHNGAQFKAWHNTGPWGGNPTPTPGIAGAPWQEQTTEWRNFNKYTGGAIVTYNGDEYQALHDIGPWDGNPTPAPDTAGAPWIKIT